MCMVTSPVNPPLHTPDTCRTIPHPLCRGIASSGCALGPRHLLLCFLGPQAELDLPCQNMTWSLCSPLPKKCAPNERAELPSHHHPGVKMDAGKRGLLKAGAALAKRRWRLWMSIPVTSGIQQLK